MCQFQKKLNNIYPILQKYKTSPRAMLSYRSTREFASTREKCWVTNSQVLLQLNIASGRVLYFFYKISQINKRGKNQANFKFYYMYC